MADKTENLVLEHLRNIRAEVAAIRSEMRAEIGSLRSDTNQGFAGLSQRLDSLETEVRGVGYVATVSIGSVLFDISDLKARVKRLEKA